MLSGLLVCRTPLELKFLRDGICREYSKTTQEVSVCAIVLGPVPPLIPFTPCFIKNATSLKVQNSFKAAFKSLFQHKGNSVIINHKGAKTHFKVFLQILDTLYR